jgi:hypothetical protein
MKKLVLYTFIITVISACGGSQVPKADGNNVKADSTGANSNGSATAVPQTTQSAIPEGSMKSGSVASNPSAPAKPVFQYSGKVKEVLFFSPTSEELVAITANENDDTQRMQIDNFELNANQFIESTPFEGYNFRFYEMSEIVLPMPNGELFRLQRNTQDLLCGVILYDGIKAPKVLKGNLKSTDYQKEAKAYFK